MIGLKVEELFEMDQIGLTQSRVAPEELAQFVCCVGGVIWGEIEICPKFHRLAFVMV